MIQLSIGPPAISADGKWLLYSSGTFSQRRIFGVRLGDSVSAPAALVPDSLPQVHPALSPNGRWLAFVGVTSGIAQIFVVPFPNATSGKWVASSRSSSQPIWSHRGNELFFRQGDSVVTLPVSTNGSFSFGRPKSLFLATSFATGSAAANRSVSPDDSRFLFARLAGEAEEEKLTVGENWLSDLKRRR